MTAEKNKSYGEKNEERIDRALEKFEEKASGNKDKEKEEKRKEASQE